MGVKRMPEPCSPDGGSLQEYIDNLPGRGGCCWYMAGVKIVLTRVSKEEVHLCIPVPEGTDALKYIDTLMVNEVLPRVPTLPMGSIIEEISTSPTWEVTTLHYYNDPK
jgi:hypothetical protein